MQTFNSLPDTVCAQSESKTVLFHSLHLLP